MYDFDLFDDGCSIGRDEQSTEVVDQEFISTLYRDSVGWTGTSIITQRTVWSKTRPYEI